MQALDVGYRTSPPDRREVALVAVPERRGGASSQPRAHGLRRIAPLLHRHRGDARESHDVALLIAHANHVTEREHLRVAGERQVGLDGHAAGAVQLGACQRAELLREAGCRYAGGPDHGVRRDPLGLPVRRPRGHAIAVDVDDGVAEHRRHTEVDQRPLRAPRERLRERSEHAVGGLEQQHPALARIDRAEVASKRVA